jgi:hypothetical protein
MICKRIYFMGLMLGVLCALLGFAPIAPAAAAPKAVVDQKFFKFDEVLEGEVIKHAFTIRNTGDAELVIESVRSSCGCTTVKKPDKIAPGGSDQIAIEGNTKNYGGYNFTKTIHVVTNDPEQKQIELKIDGPVALFADIKPTRISLYGAIGENLSAESIITPQPKYPFKVISAEPEDALKGKVEVGVSKKENGYVVKVRNKVSREERYRGKIIVKTDSPLKPQLDLHVYARISKKSE